MRDSHSNISDDVGILVTLNPAFASPYLLLCRLSSTPLHKSRVVFTPPPSSHNNPALQTWKNTRLGIEPKTRVIKSLV